MSKAVAHTRYRNKDGAIIPGVTTIIGQLDDGKSGAFAGAANKLGLKGIDSRKLWGEMADIGTLAHSFIVADMKGEKTDTSDYSQDMIDQAENSYLSWLEWRKGKKLEPILMETPLISEEFQYGGTLDYYGKVDSYLDLDDYKTGGIYRVAYIQTCGYIQLLTENGYTRPDRIVILGLPRTNNEKFQEVIYTNFDPGIKTFLLLRELCEKLKEIK